LWLTISDKGRGFDPRALGQTAGFGLLSTRERVELLGGRMKIRSAPGRGSTFLIAVPDGEVLPQMGAAGADAATPHKARERLRVLLADDHEVVREGLALLLNEQEDIEVVGQAANGVEALDLAHRLQPDVVVMDVAMPLMEGDEAARQIKRDMPRTRIVGLSMFEEPEAVEKMHQAGVERYMLKTAPAEELLAAIREK
jgi:CheY-like chemotaxis protein